MRPDRMSTPSPDAQPVARWEFMSIALMLIASHGDEAEAYAQAKLEAARAGGADHAGERVTWAEVVKLLPEARLAQQQRR